MMHFVRTVWIMRAYRLRHIIMWRFQITEKFDSSKTLLKMAGGECMRSIPSDGHDKPLCAKAITIIDNCKKALSVTDNR